LFESPGQDVAKQFLCSTERTDISAINVTEDEKELAFNINGANDEMELVPHITSDAIGDDLRRGSAFRLAEGYIMPARSVVTFTGSLDNITGVEEINSLPETHELIKNYPNPFNPETVIEYRISEKSRVEIHVYDTLGRKVETLVDSVNPAGNYSVRFRPAELAGGFYIARMICENYTASAKMIYMK